MAETVIVLYLSHFWSKFDEILYAEIFLPTWKAYHFSSRSQRLQGQRPQGHKGQRPRKFETNFLCTLFICESITPTFEAQFPQYHRTYGNCQLCMGGVKNKSKPATKFCNFVIGKSTKINNNYSLLQTRQREITFPKERQFFLKEYVFLQQR